MKTKSALAHIDKAIEGVQRLIKTPPNERDLDPWYRETSIALEHIFGGESRQLTDFKAVRYSLPAWSSNTPEAAFEGAETDGCVFRSKLNPRFG